MKPIYCLLAIFLIMSCSNNSDVKDLTPAKKQAIVTEDSCAKWKLNPVSFTLGFPENFELIYHSRDQEYLRLKDYADGRIIVKEFSIGTVDKFSEEEMKKWIYRSDSLLLKLKTYQSNFIGEKMLASRKRFLLQGTVNFDGFNRPDYKGDYTILVTLIPSDKKPGGVSLSFLSKVKSDSLLQDKDLNTLLSSLTFEK